MKAPLLPESDWNGKIVTVMGLGLFGGGLGAAAFALRQGATVTVTDLRDGDTLRETVDELMLLPGAERIRLVLGEHHEDDFTGADIVLVNPAVPPQARFVQLAHKGGARVTTAIELLLGGLCCRVVAVTGTHGKSSTVHFTAALLRASLGPDIRVVLGGNIGGSLLSEMESLRPEDIVVLELSSYQLEHLSESFLGTTAKTRAVDVAAITTLGIDHLARHGTIESYHAAKRRIGELAGQLGLDPGTIIVPANVVDAFPDAQQLKSHGVSPGCAPSLASGTEGLRVPGSFQRENLALALAIGEALGADRSAMESAVPTLTGLPHRMERLTELVSGRGGRTLFVHDNGVSTTPESTVAALESLGTPAGQRVVVVGGRAKRGCDMGALAAAAAGLDWLILPFGAAASEIALAAKEAGARLLDSSGRENAQDRDSWPGDVEEAIEGRLAPLVAGPSAGTAESPESPLHVLFSPACTSFDRYPNFRMRALAFRKAMLALTLPAVDDAVTGIDHATERTQSKD